MASSFGAGGLTGAAAAGEQIGVGQSPGIEFVFQGGGHRLLSAHVGKGTGTPFTV